MDFKRSLIGIAAVAGLLVLAISGSAPPPQQSAGSPSRDAPDWNLQTRFASRQERQDWIALETSQRIQVGQKAREFLQKHPDSDRAPVAHYLIAVEAYERGNWTAFAEHGEGALAQMSQVVGADPKQAVRWLQLLAQLAFYYAESGRHDLGIARAKSLLEILDRDRDTSNLTREQWQELSRQFGATAHYALGRSYLGRFDAQDQPEKRTALLTDALSHLRSALDLNPADDYAALRLGAAYRLAGDSLRARQSLARAALLGGVAASTARQALQRLGVGDADIEAFLEGQRESLRQDLSARPRSVFTLGDGRPHPTFWWDGVPESARSSKQVDAISNIRRSDYVGPDACRKCHATNYRAWSVHPHRRMNALAGPQTVSGDFSGSGSIDYMGGKAVFYREGEAYRMRLERGLWKRTYEVRRTLGSRFFQYYVGRQVQGPEVREDPIWTEDHVLPFGYWLDNRQWVPVVHIEQELPDQQRKDPFASASRIHYDRSCSACHTTRPLGDWMLMTDGRLRLGQFSPREFTFWIAPYLSESHPDLLKPGSSPSDLPTRDIYRILNRVDSLPAVEKAVNLGISCEACHNGAREHVLHSTRDETQRRPYFFPSAPQLFIDSKEPPEDLWGRTSRNVNWVCARCHSGGRPRYAGGMDTWNSTEYSDAIRGACYLKPTDSADTKRGLTCVGCHDPHFATGKKWARTAAQDDAKCLECHSQLRDGARRQAHTRHEEGSSGARCMNCHMPRINEGLQDMVRTHRIFSPTETRMIEANQPNACNLCHTNRPIDWTLRYLRDWYGASYSEEKLAEAYPKRERSVALGWLESAHEPTRLAGADALLRSGARWALPQLLETLDDPYMINRQFGQRGLEKMLGVRLDDFGYRFFQFSDQRREPLRKIRKELLESNPQ